MSTQLSTSNSLNDLQTLYRERLIKDRRPQEQGKKVIGYFCNFVPLEILTAMDLVPFRIQGNMHKPLVKADVYLENIMCPFIRSCFDLALNGEYDFLDGLVVPHSCDTVQSIYDIWLSHQHLSYHHFINVPHMVQPSSYEFFKKELETFVRSLEKYTGQKCTGDKLRKSIDDYNRNRELLRELYDLRKSDPPRISGTTVLELLIVGMGMQVNTYSDLILKVMEESETQNYADSRSNARIMIYGSEMDDTAFVRLIEESGANVVVDDICIGTRYFLEDVETVGDPFMALARHYLRDIHCPRTNRPQGKSRKDDLEERFGYLGRFVHDFSVDGAILDVMRFCDTHELEVPDIKDYLESLGIPSLHIEDDYTAFSTEQLKTRVQAFLEMID